MKQRKVPLRKCVACQEMMPKKTLIRIVRSPEGEVSIDLTGKSRAAALISAARRNALSSLINRVLLIGRSKLRLVTRFMNSSLAISWPSRMNSLLLRLEMRMKMSKAQPLSGLGLAMRAGKLVTGDELVLKSIRSREAKLVIVAGMLPPIHRRNSGTNAGPTTFR